MPFTDTLRHTFVGLQPDIVHTHTPFVLGSVGLHWGHQAGVPVVSTNHTLYTEYAHYVPVVPKAATKAFLIKWMKWYYSQCDAVVVPSKPVESVLKGYGVASRIEVIKSGVVAGPTDGRQDIRRIFDIPEDAFLLLYVGRVAREKNLGLLLRSFKIIRKRHPEARLMIVGSGPYEQASEVQAHQLGIDRAVKFAGMLDRSVVAKIYSAADAFVFPSLTETQGLVLCEALSVGLPCIAVRAAGTPEVVDDGVDGILTNNSVHDFAKATCKLIADPELRNRLSSGGLRNSVRFSTGAMAERFEMFYQSAIDGKERNRQGTDNKESGG
jgi:glycosyltransferase involved in cell wall biosynthesis